jgi:hypothetical protein
MKYEKLEMVGEEPLMIRANYHTEKYNDRKVTDLSVGYDNTIWTTIPEYDEEGYNSVCITWNEEK